MSLYTCDCCGYSTTNKGSYKAHLNTKKHKKNIDLENKNINENADNSQAIVPDNPNFNYVDELETIIENKDKMIDELNDTIEEKNNLIKILNDTINKLQGDMMNDPDSTNINNKGIINNITIYHIIDKKEIERLKLLEA